MAGISSKAVGKLENRFKFNDATELNTDLGLDWYETKHRGYDAQLGRFHQIDILTDFFHEESAYTFCGNNPISFNDPLGLSKRGKGFPDDKEADDDLPEVVVRPKKKQTGADFGFGWANFDKKGAKRELDLRYTYFQQRNAGQPAGDNSTYEKLYQKEQENRAMQMWVAGIVSAPLVGVAVAESGILFSSGRLASYSGKALMRVANYFPKLFAGTMSARMGSAAADLLVQYSLNIGKGYGLLGKNISNINISSVGANFAMPGSALGSSVVGSGFSLNLNGQYNGVFSNASGSVIATNIILGYGGNKIGSGLSSLGAQYMNAGSFLNNFVGNVHGNVISGGGQLINEIANGQ